MRSLKVKVISGVLIGVLVLTMGITALANDSDSEDFIGYNRRVCINQGYREPDGQLTIILDKLVEEGTITQSTVDSILEYIEKRAEERKEMANEQKRYGGPRLGPRMNILQELEEEGVITSEEVEKIREKQEELRNERLTEALNGLVDNEVIKADDVEKIRTYMETKREEKREELEKIMNMSVEERKEYFVNNKKERIDIIDQMIQDGIITEEQGEEIRKFLSGQNKIKPFGYRPHGQKPWKKGPFRNKPFDK